MHKIQISDKEAGQRLDKFLHKYLPLAPASFFYKMLRKKNITLNGKKAEGKEKLATGDILSFYLADATILGLQEAIHTAEYETAYEKLKGITVVYEDEHVVIMNKPTGILSQKSKEDDLSVNEWLIGYLLKSQAIDHRTLATFKPSVCNRLDRNTEGLITGAKSLAGSQELNRLISSREVKKFYRLIVKGCMKPDVYSAKNGSEVSANPEGILIEGYLVKDEKTNKVRLVSESTHEDASYIQTRYYPVKCYGDKTLVEAELITGKSHQIRVHMASIGYPLLGDYKYGDRKFNDAYKQKYHISSQLLYACRMEFPEMKAPFGALSKKVVEAPVPADFQKLMTRDYKNLRL